MSYNISSVKSMKINNLLLKMDSIFDKSFGNWIPEMGSFDPKTGQMTIECGCGQEIIGEIVGKDFKVSKMDLSGEGSGSLWNNVLEEIFKTSTGEMSAVLIWEGGDSITKVHLKDGVLKQDDLEL